MREENGNALPPDQMQNLFGGAGHVNGGIAGAGDVAADVDVDVDVDVDGDDAGDDDGDGDDDDAVARVSQQHNMHNDAELLRERGFMRDQMYVSHQTQTIDDTTEIKFNDSSKRLEEGLFGAPITKGHPRARACRKRGLKQYDTSCDIYNSSTATSKLHFSSIQLPPKSEEYDMGENFMEFGGHTTRVDDDEIFDMMRRTAVRGSSRGKRHRRAFVSDDLPPEKRQTARDRFWEVATRVFSDHYVSACASSAKNACGKCTAEEKWSTVAIVESAQRLDGMEDDILFKLCDKVGESLEWRKAFSALPDDKKIGYLRRL